MRRALVVLIAAISLGSVFAAFQARAAAKEWHFSRISVSAVVASDGSMAVTEERTYDFKGSFTFAFVNLSNESGFRYSDIQVLEGSQTFRPATAADRDPVKTPGTFHVENLVDHSRVTWYYRASDETRSFTVRYRISGAVKSYDDVAELNWKVLGEDQEVDTDYFAYNVTLPEPGAAHPDLRIWQHGPLNGEIHADSATSITGVTRNVPPKRFVEARLIFPKNLVPQAERIAASRLQTALAEEQQSADAANRQRTVARLQGVLILLFLVVSAGSFFYLFFRYGKEYKPFVGEYEHDVPVDYSPAVMAHIYRYGKTRPDDLTATIMDLARRGYLRITQNEVDAGWFSKTKKIHLFEKLTPPPGQSLTTYESALLTWAFDRVGDGTRVTDEELAAHATASSNRFSTWWSSWTKKVKDDADQQGWLERRSITKKTINILIGLGVGGLGVFMLNRGVIAAIVLIVAGVLQVVFSPLIRRRSMKGATDFERIDAFKRFLSDFSEMERMPPAALAVWERYLVYAIPLGLADEVVESMRRLAPVAATQATASGWSSGWMHTAGGDGGGFPDFSSLTSSFSGFVSAATSSSSSGSGGGGGSSGGGGGGGGGSSGGAG